MYKGKFNESQRLAILAEQDEGKNVEEICRHYQISPATFYKWKKDIIVLETVYQKKDHRFLF